MTEGLQGRFDRLIQSDLSDRHQEHGDAAVAVLAHHVQGSSRRVVTVSSSREGWHGPDLRVGRRPGRGSWRGRGSTLPELPQRCLLPQDPLDQAGQPLLRAGHAVRDGRIPHLPGLPGPASRSLRRISPRSRGCARPRRCSERVGSPNSTPCPNGGVLAVDGGGADGR